MLNRIRAFFSYHRQASVLSLNQLSQNPLVSFMTMVVIAVALALPSLFILISQNVSQLTLDWQRQGHIALYLAPHVSDAQANTLLDTIKQTPGVDRALFKSPAEGLEELTQQEGMQNIMHYLPENPLPAVIHVSPSLKVDSSEKLSELSQQLQQLEGVAEAKVDIEWIRRLDALLSFVTEFGLGLLSLLALAVVLIIAITLRLALHSRYEEIQVLKLIGAKDSFILRPFLYTGIYYALIGSILAVLLVNILALSSGTVINELAGVYQMHYPLVSLSIVQILQLILFAIILGWCGAFLSVKRQLAAIEPQL